MRLKPLTLAALLLVWCLLPSTISGAHNDVDSLRLTRSVLPSHYELYVETYLGDEPEGFKFFGEVNITLSAMVAGVREVRLHAQDLQVDAAAAQLSHDAGPAPAVARVGRGPRPELLQVLLSSPLVPGQLYRLRLAFSAPLGRGLAGYYRSSYEDHVSNQTRWLAVTNFEPTDARRAFPCFDEPSFKATFTISLAHLDKYTAVSNMPAESTKPMPGRPGWVVDRFAPSQRMSTYLVAYLVSDLLHVDSATADNSTVFRVWARRDAVRQAAYASHVGPRVLSFYEDFFQVPYPLPKQDMAAIPDFPAGAMENWGLITYRETRVLFDPKVSSVHAKHAAANVIAHELAHQWFGNLVTMRWWSDLWLNEGFATYVATLGVHAVHPKWKSLDTDALSNMLTVLKMDALGTSHPLSVTIEDTSQIAEIFDAISYQKGAVLIRMMSHFLSEEVFRQGLTNYLQKHRLENAEQDDLWAALTAEANRQGTLPNNMTVKAIMDTWTLQRGYPVLTVSRDYERGVVNITQTRYQPYQQEDSRHARSSGCWHVPVTYTTAQNPGTVHRTWLHCRQMQIRVGSQHWLLLNVNATGLYRVLYDERGWKQLTQMLERDPQAVPPLNRAQLLEDALELAWSGDLPYRSALSLLSYLRGENHYLPWKAALTNLESLSRILHRTTGYDVFKAYLMRLLVPAQRTWGDLQMALRRDDLESLRHRGLVVCWLCRLEVQSCVGQARQLFRNYMQRADPDRDAPFSSDLRYEVVCTALKHGGIAEWEFVWQQYLSSNGTSQQVELLRALSCTQDARLLQRLLDWSIEDGKGIRRQNSPIVFSGVANNVDGFLIAKDFLTRNIAKLYELHSPKVNTLSKYVKAIAEEIFLEHDQLEFDSFIEQSAQYLKPAEMGVKQARDRVTVNVAWYHSHFKTLVSELHRSLM